MQDLIKISYENLITVKVLKNNITITAAQGANKTEFNITGITIIPHFAEVKSSDIRDKIIDKNQSQLGISKIDELTNKGVYIVNIRDYSIYEIQRFAQIITRKWLDEIWNILIKTETKPFYLSLKDSKVKEFILIENSDLFNTEAEFDNFCSQYSLSIKDFIIHANFSELDIKLKEIEARLQLEQFYARRFLFCSMLIDGLQKRVSDYTLNGNHIETENLNLFNNWIVRMKKGLQILKEFKDYHKLYDMPKNDKKIKIKDSKNVFISNKLTNSKIENSTKKTSDTKTSKRIGIWTIVLMAIGIIVTIIINWDKIF